MAADSGVGQVRDRWTAAVAGRWCRYGLGRQAPSVRCGCLLLRAYCWAGAAGADAAPHPAR